VHTSLAPVPLTAADRCDRCGARAYIRVVLPGGADLLFCAHHGRTHEDALKQRAVEFQDHTQVLTATPHIAPDDER
jgi:hypothetical protein